MSYFSDKQVADKQSSAILVRERVSSMKRPYQRNLPFFSQSLNLKDLVYIDIYNIQTVYYLLVIYISGPPERMSVRNYLVVLNGIVSIISER